MFSSQFPWHTHGNCVSTLWILRFLFEFTFQQWVDDVSEVTYEDIESKAVSESVNFPYIVVLPQWKLDVTTKQIPIHSNEFVGILGADAGMKLLTTW